MPVEVFRPAEGGSGSLTMLRVTEEAKATALRRGGHAPTLLVEGQQSLIGATIHNLPDTHDERARLLFATGVAMAETSNLGELMQVYLISESWLSLSTKDRPPIQPPSNDPHRKDVLTIFQIELAGPTTHMRLLEMHRNPDGHLTALTDLSLPEKDATQKGSGRAESPLLEAFVAGYRRGRARKFN